MLRLRDSPRLKALRRKDDPARCANLKHSSSERIDVNSIHSRIPVFAFNNYKVLIEVPLMTNQNIDLARCPRTANENNVMFNAHFSGLVKLRNQLLEAAPVRR